MALPAVEWCDGSIGAAAPGNPTLFLSPRIRLEIHSRQRAGSLWGPASCRPTAAESLSLPPASSGGYTAGIPYKPLHRRWRRVVAKALRRS